MKKSSGSSLLKLALAGVAVIAVASTPLLGSAADLSSSPFHIRATNSEQPSTYAIKPFIKQGAGTGDSQPGTGTGGSTSPTTPPATSAPTPDPTPSTPTDPSADLISIDLDTTKCNQGTVSLNTASYSSIDPTVKLPLNATIDWGDGSKQAMTYGSMNHNYKSYGKYTWNIKGTIGGLTTSSSSACYTAVTNMGDETGIKTLEGFLNGARNLTAMVEPPVTLENAARMMQSTTSFNGDTSQWTLPNLKDASLMFSGASIYNGDLGNLDTRNLTKASGMFSAAYLFEGKGLENWKTPVLENASAMFNNAKKFNAPIGSWDVSKVKSFVSMFEDASIFNQPIGDWSPVSATTMQNMFKNDRVFNQPIDNWNLSNVTTFEGMFYNALKFNQPINGWNVSGATTFVNIFRNETGGVMAFNQPLDKWDTSSAVNMTTFFWYTTNYSQDLSMWNVDKVLYHSAFNAGTKLTTAQMPKWKQ